jgi:hypothetical protein
LIILESKAEQFILKKDEFNWTQLMSFEIFCQYNSTEFIDNFFGTITQNFIRFFKIWSCKNPWDLLTKWPDYRFIILIIWINALKFGLYYNEMKTIKSSFCVLIIVCQFFPFMNYIQQCQKSECFCMIFKFSNQNQN